MRTITAMSFDVYFQRLADGDAGEGGRDEVVGVLGPYLGPSMAERSWSVRALRYGALIANSE